MNDDGSDRIFESDLNKQTAANTFFLSQTYSSPGDVQFRCYGLYAKSAIPNGVDPFVSGRKIFWS